MNVSIKFPVTENVVLRFISWDSSYMYRYKMANMLDTEDRRCYFFFIIDLVDFGTVRVNSFHAKGVCRQTRLCFIFPLTHKRALQGFADSYRNMSRDGRTGFFTLWMP
jgi:hypothetical protein